MHDRQVLGATGEEVAADHLRAQGMQVREQNWRVSREGVRGELDLVAIEGRTLVVVEVKVRSGGTAGPAVAAIGWDKRRRLRRLTALYLADHPHAGPVRGDVIAIDRDSRGSGWTLRHLRGVW